MSTSLDIRMLPKAKALIAKYGKSIQLVPATVAYTAAQSEGTRTESTPQTVKITPPEPYETRFIDGDLIKIGDTHCYMAAKDAPAIPEEGMRAVIDGVRWLIVAVNKVYSGDDVCLYELQMRL
jgi:hypothetical protein